MRAYLIDPAVRKIEEINYAGDYQEIQRQLSYTADPVLFTVIEVQRRDTLFVDDEGLLKRGLHAFHWLGFPSPLAGKGLILGTDREGNSTSARLLLAEVEEFVIWTELVTTAQFDTSGGVVELPNGTVGIMGDQPIWGVE